MKGILKYFLVLFILCSVSPVWAGPPFATDDPEPVEYRHWEIFLVAVYSDNLEGLSGAAPQLDLNYGLFPEAHLNLVVPFAFEAPAGGPSAYGFGAHLRRAGPGRKALRGNAGIRRELRSLR